MSATMATRLDGPAVEQQVAGDIIRRGAKVAPVLVLVCTLVWGVHGGLSSAYAVAIVLINFAFSAALLGWTARISLALMMGAALVGYLVRLALVAIAVLLVKDLSWVSLWPLGVSLIVTHLGLLLWETQFVSASLAFPGLKPRKD